MNIPKQGHLYAFEISMTEGTMMRRKGKHLPGLSCNWNRFPWVPHTHWVYMDSSLQHIPYMISSQPILKYKYKYTNIHHHNIQD